MNIDTMIREALRVNADDAPANAGLLDAVHSRSRRRRLQQRLVVAGAVAAVAAVTVAAPILIGAGGAGEESSTPPGGWPEPTPTPALATPGPTVIVPLVAPDYELPEFPFTPTWTPDGAAESARGVATEAGIPDDDGGWFRFTWLTHYDDAGRALITVNVSGAEPDHLDLWYESETEPVTVQGRDAVLRLGPVRRHQELATDVSLTWEHEPEQWVTVYGESGISTLDLSEYAEGLVEEPLPATAPFTFDLVPDGGEPGFSGRGTFGFAAASADETGLVSLSLFHYDGPTEPTPEGGAQPLIGSGEAVQVGDLDGEFIDGNGEDRLHVFLDDGLVLSVITSGALSLSQDDLVRFAAGVQITEYAVAGTETAG